MALVERYQKFLNNSWAVHSSNDRAHYDAIQTVGGEDFLRDFDFGKHIRMLILGVGDIHNLVKSIAGLKSEIHLKIPVEELTVHINDVDPCVLARNIILLNILGSIDGTSDEDIDFLWSVWYNVALSNNHKDRLDAVIERLICEDHSDAMIKIPDENDREMLREIFVSWLSKERSLEDVLEKRLIALGHQYWRKSEAEIKTMVSLNPQDETFLATNFIILNLLQVYMILTDKVQKKPGVDELLLPQEIKMFQKEVETFYKTGTADPHYGVAGKSWKNIKHTQVNSTLMRPDGDEYYVDYMVSPYFSFLPLALDKNSTSHPIKSLGEECSLKLKAMVQDYQSIISSGKLNLTLSFHVDNAVHLVSCGALSDQKFDFIHASSLIDNIGLMPMLILLQPFLRNIDSVLRTDTLLWKGFYSSPQDFVSDALRDLDPLLMPAVLGLRLATNFDLGKRQPMTDCQLYAFEPTFRYPETLYWAKAWTTDPIQFRENSPMARYLKQFVNWIFDEGKDKFENHKQTPYLLYRLLDHITEGIRENVVQLVEYVESCIPSKSPWICEWKSILAAHGYTAKDDSLLLLRIALDPPIGPVGEVYSLVPAFPRSGLLVLSTSTSDNQAYFRSTAMDMNSVEFVILESLWKDFKYGSTVIALRDFKDLTKPIELEMPILGRAVNMGMEIVIEKCNVIKPLTAERHEKIVQIEESIGYYMVTFPCADPDITKDCFSCTLDFLDNLFHLNHRCKRHEEENFVVNFSSNVDIARSSLKPSPYKVTVHVPKGKLRNKGRGVLPLARVDLSQLEKYRPNKDTDILCRDHIWSSLLCLPGDTDIEDGTGVPPENNWFWMFRCLISGLMRESSKRVCIVGKFLIYKLGLYWFDGLPMLSVVYCIYDEMTRAIETDYADVNWIMNEEAAHVHGLMLQDLENPKLIYRANVMRGSKVESLFEELLEANSLQITQTFNVMYHYVKQSFISLRFPQVAPIILNSDQLLEIEKTRKSLGPAQDFENGKKYYMKKENCCGYCGRYTLTHLKVSAQAPVKAKYCDTTCQMFHVKCMTSMCSFCGKTGGDLKACAKCHQVRYCGRDCQTSHWRQHKKPCKMMVEKLNSDVTAKKVCSLRKLARPSDTATSELDASIGKISITGFGDGAHIASTSAQSSQINESRMTSQKSEEVNVGKCNECGKESDLKRCSRCKAVAYCSRQCQALAWADHKFMCNTQAAA